MLKPNYNYPMLKISYKKFSLIWLALVFLCLSGMAILNIYYNPWGNYGEKGVFALYNARLKKHNI